VQRVFGADRVDLVLAGLRQALLGALLRFPSAVDIDVALALGGVDDEAYFVVLHLGKAAGQDELLIAAPRSSVPTYMKADSGRSSPSPSQRRSNESIGVLEAGVDAGEAREDLGDVEGLAEEALDLPGAGHDELVVFGELVDAEDGDDVLQVLVALQDLLDASGETA
jgi:hypothetical protein